MNKKDSGGTITILVVILLALYSGAALSAMKIESPITGGIPVVNLDISENKKVTLNSGLANTTKVKMVLKSKDNGNNIVTRGEFAVQLASLMGIDTKNFKVNSHFYKDVRSSTKASKEIYALAEQRIMPGFEDGSFKPERSITRGDAIVLLARVLPAYSSPVARINYGDVKPGHYAYDAVNKAYAYGILEEQKDFRPTGSLYAKDMNRWISIIEKSLAKQKELSK